MRRRRRRNPWFWFGVGAGGLTLAASLGAASLHAPELRPWQSVAALAPVFSQPPVLVFLVGHPSRVASVRRAVADERLVSESPGAFLLEEGRLVAATRADAARLLSHEDWRDRELELFEFARAPRDREPPPGPDESSESRVAELVNRPTLTWAEARAVLSRWE